MTKFLRYAATGITLCFSLFTGWGCSDEDNGTKPPRYTEPLTITEIGKNYVGYHVEAAEGISYRHLIVSRQTLDNFTSGSKNDEEYNNAVRVLMSLDARIGTGAHDYILRDLDEKPISQQPYSVIAGLKHVALICQADETGNCIGDIEELEFSTAAPARLSQTIKVEIVDLRSGEADFLNTPDPGIRYYFEQLLPKTLADEFAASGKDKLREQLISIGARIFEFGKKSEWGYLDPETDYVHLVLGIDNEGNQTKLIETPFKTPASAVIDTENVQLNQSPKAFYYGQSEGDDGQDMYNFYFLLSDKPMPDNEYYEPYPTAFPCNALNCDLYTAAPAAGKPRIPEGTYTFSESYLAGIWHSEYTWAAYFDAEENETQFGFSSGTITVAHEGTGYRIDFDLKTENGKIYSGSFTGEIPFQDASSYAPGLRQASGKGLRFTRENRMPSCR